MPRRPTDGPIANTSRHQATSVAANFLRIGFQGETSDSHQSAQAYMVALSTTAMESCAGRLVVRPPNSAVAQSHRTRCTSSRMLGEFDS